MDAQRLERLLKLTNEAEHGGPAAFDRWRAEIDPLTQDELLELLEYRARHTEGAFVLTAGPDGSRDVIGRPGKMLDTMRFLASDDGGVKH